MLSGGSSTLSWSASHATACGIDRLVTGDHADALFLGFDRFFRGFPPDLNGYTTAIAALRPEEKVVQKYEQGASNIVGIDIKATPPGKKLASIQALSGGERALTSIALLCSLLTCFPSPFVVLDEVDAALDDANTIRFGQILGTLAHQTQFITITHNRETMAQAAILYGVTMGDDGVSKLLSVKIEQAKQFAK